MISLLLLIFLVISIINLKLNSININLTPQETLQLLVKSEIKKNQKIIKLSDIIFPNDSGIKTDETNKYSNILLVFTSTTTDKIESSILISISEEDKNIFIFSIPSNMYFVSDIDFTNKKDILDNYNQYLNMQFQYIAIIDENLMPELFPSNFQYEYFSQIETIVGTSSTPIVKGINIINKNDTFWIYYNSENKSSLLTNIITKTIKDSNSTQILKDLFYKSEHTDISIAEDEKFTKLLNTQSSNLVPFILLENKSTNIYKIKEVDNSISIYPLTNEKIFHEFSDYIFYSRSFPEIYNEDINIYIYNSGLGYKESFDWTQSFRRNFPFINILYMGNNEQEFEKSIIKATNDLSEGLLQKLSDNSKISTTEILTNSEETKSIYIYLSR